MFVNFLHELVFRILFVSAETKSSSKISIETEEDKIEGHPKNYLPH